MANSLERTPPVWAALLSLAALLGACGPREIEGVQTFAHPGGDQRPGSLVYAQVPPAGGPHSAMWQTCGVYPAPLYNEYAVHTLALGAVWVTYRPDLGAEGVAKLRALLADRPLSLLSPYPGQDRPVAVTVWNTQLKVPTPDDPRLKAFVERYGTGETAPLRGAPCAGGFGGTR